LPINFITAASISTKIEAAADDCDEMVVMYNHFKNVVTNVITKVTLLARPHFLKQFKFVCRHEAEEPEKFFSENYFYELYLSSTIYHALLHARTCEEASRMNAMENATKNAKEMLDKLTL